MWVGPTHLTGPNSAQKGWADLGTTFFSTSFYLGRTRPRHQGWARTGLALKEKTGRGIIFPLPSSCIQNDIHSACRRNLIKKQSKSGGERRVTWRGGGGAFLVWLLC